MQRHKLLKQTALSGWINTVPTLLRDVNKRPHSDELFFMSPIHREERLKL
jgi:hypothetical protein